MEASRIDARASVFNIVGGNQINNYNCGTIYHHHLPRNDLPLLGTDTNTLLQQSLLTNRRSADAIFSIDGAVLLINHISNSLIDHMDSSYHDRERELTLKTLRQILRLVKHAIKLYSNRPLGPSLIHAITPEVQRCRAILSEMLDKVHGTWVGLVCTRISEVWCKVFRERWVGDEFASLKRRLCDSQNSLQMVLTLLNSYVFLSS